MSRRSPFGAGTAEEMKRWALASGSFTNPASTARPAYLVQILVNSLKQKGFELGVQRIRTRQGNLQKLSKAR